MSALQSTGSTRESWPRPPPLLVTPVRVLDGLSWSLIGLVVLFALPLHVAGAVTRAFDEDPNWGGALYTALGSVVDGLLVLVFATLLANLRRPRMPQAVALGVAVLAGIASSRILFNVPAALGVIPAGAEGPTTGSIVGDVVWQGRRSLLYWSIIAAAWYFLQRAQARASRLRKAEHARLQLSALLVEARLQVLRAQTEPHFLFNTLAHVKRLYRTDPVLGRTMLDRFCDYLRVALPQIRTGVVTLGRELELALAYLDVQRIRMGGRLSLRVDVPADVQQLPFPSMALLTLVENAVKHGLSPVPEGGEIAITARVEQGALNVSVADTGRGFTASKGSGTGLVNVRAQLAALYGSASSLSVGPNSPRGVIATVVLRGVAPDGNPAVSPVTRDDGVPRPFPHPLPDCR